MALPLTIAASVLGSCLAGPLVYTAAVVEYSPLIPTAPANFTPAGAQAILLANLEAVRTFAAHVRSQGATIVVFPEYGLNGPVFSTRDMALPFLQVIPPLPQHSDGPSNHSLPNPCRSPDAFPNATAIVRASCVALETGVDLVLNLGEVAWCSIHDDPACPADGRYQFNTQVAFLRDGRLAAKHRKSRLYFEPAFDAPASPTPNSFLSSAGVRFGMLICFEIMFPTPALWLRNGTCGADDPTGRCPPVRDVVYSTWWVNYAPLLTATQVQSSWSSRLGMNLLAAGAGRGAFNSGSGIYVANATLSRSFFNPTATPQSTSLVVADIPTVATAAEGSCETSATTQPPQAPDSASRRPLASPSAFPMNLTLFDPSSWTPADTHALQARVLDLSCDANVSLHSIPTFPSLAATNATQYAVLAASGSYNGIFPAAMCALLRCPSGTNSCFEDENTLDGSVVFERVELRANFNATWTAFVEGAVSTGDAVLNGALTLDTDLDDAAAALWVREALPPSQQSRPLLDFLLLGLVFD